MIHIERDDPARWADHRLLSEHRADTFVISPAESVHALAHRDYERICLETGTDEFFAPARHLYARNGFTECPPFADYTPDPNSVFMERRF
ncbi:hypothetical protein [Arthrobacter bambusae]|uniref:Acetyltransferase n=1 Tax=Arthrobacter bambusae TaxID=1338426 RepID=A0AAW8DEB1_9MICC|nr:hypothetical protein [Arthrobacter bambusae]MDP9904620.1 hypothetical protein [Arthrobacter bambusae]MDQ0129436.1 hypothetical protein [Arthrobacter bambusae]MDQ0180951.1 hypothetical protein [Arthrobacter bambusae]